MIDRFEGNYRKRLPPDLAMTAQITRASLLAAAAASGDARLASHQDVARHEAGHVVGYAMLGVRTRRSWVRRFKAGWIGRTERYGLPVWGAPLGHEGRFMTPPAGMAQAVFCLSGPLAEREGGGGEGLANLAADFPEMLEGFAMLRLSVALALFPDALPSDDGADGLVESSFRDMGGRLHAWLLGELRRNGEPLDAIAAKLVTQGRLTAHEIAPLVRGITPASPSDLFDHLRQGLAVGPLPPDIPPAYLEAMQAAALGSDVG